MCVQRFEMAGIYRRNCDDRSRYIVYLDTIVDREDLAAYTQTTNRAWETVKNMIVLFMRRFLLKKILLIKENILIRPRM